MPQGLKRPQLPIMTVNGTAPDKSGNVIVGIPELEHLKGKVVQLENDDHAYSLLKIIAEALGMKVGGGGSWTGTAYVSLGAFATKDTIGPDDITPELKAQLKGDKGDDGQVGPQGPRGIQGVQGEQGERGPQGERGNTGAQGQQGLQGPQGTPLVVTRTQETSDPGGYNVVLLSDGTTLNIRNGTVGPAGQKGEQGERGEKGDTGDKGDKGDKGDRGADGTVAFDYLTEEQKASLKGDKGDKGDPGESVSLEGFASEADLLAFYYPDGSVTSTDQITTDGMTFKITDDNIVCASEYTGSETRIVLPWKTVIDGVEYKVEAIGSKVLKGKNITAVIAPSTVTTIYADAFSGCSSLSEVSLPRATIVYNNAFQGCTSLTAISLPMAKTLTDYVFDGCSKLVSASLPSATNIGTNIFNRCSSLSSVSVPSVIVVGNAAFNVCGNLSKIELPSATKIGDWAFSYCSALSTIYMPNVRQIGASSFAQCSQLSVVNFGSSLTASIPTISNDSFDDSVPTSCKFIIPLGVYDEWKASSGWSGLVTKGYKFEGYANAKALEDKRDKTDLTVYEPSFTEWECVESVETGAGWRVEFVSVDQGAPADEWWLNSYNWDAPAMATLPYDANAEKLVFTVGHAMLGYDEDVIVTATRQKSTPTPTSDKIITSKDLVPLSDALEDKRGKTDLTVYVGDKNKPMLPPDALPVTWYDEPGYRIEFGSDGSYILCTGVNGFRIADFSPDGTLQSVDPTTRFGGKPGIDGQWPRLIFGGAVPTSDKVLTSADVVSLLPRYLFVDVAIKDGAVTVAPYTNAKLVSDGTAFTVAVGGVSGYMRDCVLRVECGETAPTITWPSNFHPRTGAADLACLADVRNVYKFSEYAPGEFMVSGWQETTGGNALVSYYPEGNVKDVSELTAGIKYNFAEDGAERTAFAYAFRYTDDPGNDNSGLVGRVVIPPFVDENGNPYISDDGTRYRVVGVGGGGAAAGPSTNLTDVIAPSTVTTILDSAFAYCIKLTSVSFPAVTTIGGDAFGSCEALASVSFPAAAIIGGIAFANCSALISVSLPAATTIGTNAFSVCSSLSSVSLPSATKISDGAFNGCGSLSSVSIPAVTTVGDLSFRVCTALASVDFGDTPRPSVPSLGVNAFESVPTSCKIIVPDLQYDEWVAASEWIDLVRGGYPFLRHSEWEGAAK